MNSRELRSFSEKVKGAYERKEIRAPVHLSGNNEDQLIEYFSRKRIGDEDWVVSTHRSHYHALLKGIDPDWLFGEILAGRSISIENLEKRFITSAIVSGGVSIGVGLALGTKIRKSNERVFVFVGDMAAQSGVFWEAVKYSLWNELPVEFLIEDNGLSTNTPTVGVWGGSFEFSTWPNVERYKYDRIYPHHGSGKWLQF
jgi:pyruvate dehydrogenase E1 component alpha subunit